MVYWMNNIKYIFNLLYRNRVSLISYCYSYKVWIWYLYRNWINITLLLLTVQHCIVKIILNINIYHQYLPSVFIIPYSKYFFIKKFQKGIISINKEHLWLVKKPQKQSLDYFIFVFLQQLNLLFYIYRYIYQANRRMKE